MADSVDNQIVSMKFDNATFESKIRETLDSLDKLQKSLNFSNSLKGLENVNVARANDSLASMATSVENISSKFSAMGAVAFTVISNITNKVTDASLRFAKSFAVTPIMDGFREMETKMGSVQTILANTAQHGTGLEEVMTNLSALNDYSDKTIYNFGAMTKNIGLFTNAGIKIGDATSMIKGFSNAAAASGTTAEGAAAAAYQLSQALSAGTIRLMDWRSLQNVGMGSKNMQNSLIEIADAMGVLNDVGIDAQEIQSNFNASLETNWLSADVMSSYLKIMAGDMDDASMAALGLSKAQIQAMKEQQVMAQDAATKVRTWSQLVGTIKESIGSGWAESFELILGNFDDATTLFTRINDAVGGFIGRLSEARNEVLKIWVHFGGRAFLIEGIATALKAIGDVLKTIGNAFNEVFPTDLGRTITLMSHAITRFLVALKPSKETLEDISNIFKGLFSILHVGWTIIKGIASLFITLGKALFPITSIGSNVLGIFGNFGEALFKFNTALSGGITDFFQLLAKVLGPIARLIGNVTSKVLAFFFSFSASDVLWPVLVVIESLISKFVHFFSALKDSEQVAAMVTALGHLRDMIVEFFAAIKNSEQLAKIINFLDELKNKIIDFIVSIDYFGILEDAGGIIGRFAGKLADFLSSFNYAALVKDTASLFEDLKNKIIAFFDSFEGIELGGIIDKITSLNDKSEILYKTIGAKDLGNGGMFNLSSTVKDLEDSESIFDRFFTRVNDYFQSLLDTLGNMGQKLGDAGKKIGNAFLTIFAGPDKRFDQDEFIQLLDTALFAALVLTIRRFIKDIGGLVGSVSAVFDELGKTLKAFQTKVKSQALLNIAVAMVLLTGSIVVLSTIDQESMINALGAMTAGFVSLVAVMKVLDTMKTNGIKMTATATAMAILATSMIALAKAVKMFSEMNIEELKKGLGAAAIGITIISGAMRLMQPDIAISTSVAIMALATSLFILASAVKIFSLMSLEELAVGLGAIVVSLAAISGAMRLVQANVSASTGITILALATSLIILAQAVKVFSDMSMEELAKGLTSVVIILGAMAGAMRLVQSKVAIGTGLAFLAMAKGLEVIAEAVGKMGAMRSGDLAKGLTAMGVAFGIIVIAINSMQSALAGAAAMLIVAGSLVILADVIERLGEMDLKTLAIGFAAITAAFLGLALAGAFLSPFLAALGASMLLLGAGFFLFGLGAAAAVTAFTYLAQNSEENIDKIIVAIEKFIAAIPRFIEIFMKSLAESSEEIVGSFDKISTSIEQIIIRALQTVINVIPQLRETANVIMTNILGLIRDKAPDFIDTAYALLLALGQGFMENVGELTRTGVIILARFMQTLADEAPKLVNSGVNLIIAFLRGIGSRLSDIINFGVTLIDNFIHGVALAAVSLANSAANALIVFLDGLAEAIRTNGPRIREAGLNLASAIIDGLTGGLGNIVNINRVVDRARELAGRVLDGFREVIPFASPSPLFIQIGKWIIQGLAIGLDKIRPAENSAVKSAEKIVEAFAETLGKVPSTLDGMDDFKPIITPVLDLTKIQAGAKGINTLLAPSTIRPDVSIAQARLISTASEPDDTESNESKDGPNNLTFIQNNNSPAALSTNDIYRNTKSQIALAKEELNI